MRPLVVAWMGRSGLPAWLLPDYWQLAVIATLIGSRCWRCGCASREGAPVVHTARAIACAYVGALVGGYLFEAVRSVPAALAAHSWRPVLHPGRAAYGGLLGAIAAATIYLRAVRQPLAPFFDRVAIGVGLTFALVRTGCFLAGLRLWVADGAALGGAISARQPGRAGPRAARVRPARGARSLPVHPTQLYEAASGPCWAARGRGRSRCGGLGCAMGAPSRRFWRFTPPGRFAIELRAWRPGPRDASVACRARSGCRSRSGPLWSSGGGAARVSPSATCPAVGTAFANRSAKNSALRACAGSIEKSGTAAGRRAAWRRAPRSRGWTGRAPPAPPCRGTPRARDRVSLDGQQRPQRRPAPRGTAACRRRRSRPGFDQRSGVTRSCTPAITCLGPGISMRVGRLTRKVRKRSRLWKN